MDNLDLKSAINLCESLGFVVIDKERIKNLSYSMLENKALKHSQVEKEELDRVHEEQAMNTIFEELKQKGLIKKTSREEPSFFKSAFDGSETMTLTRWSLRLLD